VAKQASSSVRVWLDHYPWSAFLTGLTFKVDQKTDEATALSDAGPRRVVDNYDHSDSLTGLFDGTDDSFDEQAQAAFADGADHYLLKCYAGTTVGSVAYESIAVVSGEPLEVKRGKAIARNVDTKGSNSLSRGLVMLNQTATGTLNGTGYNQGVTAVGTEYQMVVRVLSGTFSSITVKIQGSQNDGSPDAYSDITGLAVTRTTAGVSRASVVIATEAWKRAIVSAFSGTSAVVMVTAGTVQGT
jgi:hypothetical protein